MNDGFRKFRIDAGSMKIIENGPNVTHMALLGLKICQNECQRGCEFNGHPPDTIKPHEKSKWLISGQPGNGEKIIEKVLYQTPDNGLSGPDVT